MKKLCASGLFLLLLSSFVSAENYWTQINNNNNNNYDDQYNSDSKYDYIYYNPPRKSLQAHGRYVILSSGVRYVHSPSKGKRAAHAARINAYNYEAGNY